MDASKIYVAQVEVAGGWVDAPDPSTADGMARYPDLRACALAPRDPALTYRTVVRRPGQADEVVVDHA